MDLTSSGCLQITSISYPVPKTQLQRLLFHPRLSQTLRWQNVSVLFSDFVFPVVSFYRVLLGLEDSAEQTLTSRSCSSWTGRASCGTLNLIATPQMFVKWDFLKLFISPFLYFLCFSLAPQ